MIRLGQGDSSGRVMKRERRDLPRDWIGEKGKSRADSRFGARTTRRTELPFTRQRRVRSWCGWGGLGSSSGRGPIARPRAGDEWAAGEGSLS